jgi:hypothetical protein
LPLPTYNMLYRHLGGDRRFAAGARHPGANGDSGGFVAPLPALGELDDGVANSAQPPRQRAALDAFLPVPGLTVQDWR